MKLYLRSQGSENKGANTVSDENHNGKYILTGKWGIKNDALSVYDLSGNLLAELKQISVGVRPKFNLFMTDKLVGKVSTPLFFVKGFLWVKKLNWIIAGDTINCRFKIYHGCKKNFEVNRVQIGDRAYIEINTFDEEYIPLYICIAVILDRWIQRRPPLKHPNIVRRWKIDSASTRYGQLTNEEYHN